MILYLKGWEAADGAQALTANHCTASIKCCFCMALLSVPLTGHSTGTTDKNGTRVTQHFFLREDFLNLIQDRCQVVERATLRPGPRKAA